MTTRVTIEATASALEGESESLSGKVDAAEEQISRMANALQSPELAGEGYAAIRSVARDLAVPAAKAYYVAFDAMNSACTADAQAVRGLPQSSSGVCDTDEFQKKIEAVQSDIEETQRRIAQNRANAGGTSTNGSSGSSSGGTNTSQDTTANVNIQVDEALLESDKAEKQGYEDDLKKAQEYDEASASTYSSAQDAVSTMKSAADSVSSYLAGNGYGDTSWAAGVDDAYSTVFERRVEECAQSIYHDGGIDRDALSKLLGGDDLTPSEAEALARVWDEHSTEDGVAEAFSAAGMKDGQPTGAFSIFLIHTTQGIYDKAGGKEEFDNNAESRGKTLDAIKQMMERLFSAQVSGKANFSITITLPDGTTVTWSCESEMSEGAKGLIQKFLEENREGDGSGYRIDADLGDGWSLLGRMTGSGASVVGMSGEVDLGNGWKGSGSVSEDGWVWLTVTHTDDNTPDGVTRTESTSSGRNSETGQTSAKETYETSVKTDSAKGTTTETVQVTTTGAQPAPPQPEVVMEGVGEVSVTPVTSPSYSKNVDLGKVMDDVAIGATLAVTAIVGSEMAADFMAFIEFLLTILAL